jgi:hypothetical protein
MLENLELKISVIIKETSLPVDTSYTCITTDGMFMVLTKSIMLECFQCYVHNDDRITTAIKTSNSGSATRFIVSAGRRISRRLIHTIIVLYMLCANRRPGPFR